MPEATMSLKQLIRLHDEDQARIKLPLFAGEHLDLEVRSAKVRTGEGVFYLSTNLIDGTVVSTTLVPGIGQDVMPTLILNDIKKYGTSSLEPVVFRARRELLDLLLASFPDEYGFKLFAGRCVAPHAFVACQTTMHAASKCQDHRLIGIASHAAAKLDHRLDILFSSAVEDDVDGILRFPPVPDESKRVKGYEHMIRAAIHKMCGKWKDVYLKKHQPGSLPFSAEDLLQQGFMEVTIALRKYNSRHPSGAKESTFVYQHLWNRFGHISHKYSKRSRGYGVIMLRDKTDDEGRIISSYDQIVPSAGDESFD